MADLVLGPLLRYVSETEATIWVETSERCEVEVLGTPRADLQRRRPPLRAGPDRGPRARWLLRVRGGARRRVALAAADCDLPPSVIRTLDRGQAARHLLRLLPGRRSRTSAPYTQTKDEDENGHELDALHVLAEQMAARRPRQLAGAALPARRPGLRRRGLAARPASGSAPAATPTEPPGEEVIDFEEYTWLYRESWEDPLIRWLFSTVSTSMALGRPRHERRLEHLALLARGDGPQGVVARARGRRHHDLLDLPAPRQPLAARARRERALRAGARQARCDRGRCASGRTRSTPPPPGTRWSFHRDIGGVRAIFVDSRAGRVLTEERRSMCDDEVWEWIVEHAERRLRPPADRDHRPLPALARLPPPRGLERAALRRRLGRAGRARRASGCAAPSTSITGPPSSSPSSGCAS